MTSAAYGKRLRPVVSTATYDTRWYPVVRVADSGDDNNVREWSEGCEGGSGGGGGGYRRRPGRGRREHRRRAAVAVVAVAAALAVLLPPLILSPHP